jgi:sec-independent protein translocase protein TatA
MGSGLVSPWHIAILALVVLLVFGPKKLPEIGRSLGHGLRELKDGITHDHQQLDSSEVAPRALAKDARERDSI